MSSFAALLQSLFAEGKVLLRGPPHFDAVEDRQALELLARTFADYRLEVAGPLIDFHPGTALAAAKLLVQACWFLLNHEEPDETLHRALTMPAAPASPAQHLSADLVFRYLPQVQRRARALAADDPLALRLTALLRQWPLSGVLADVEEEPLTPLEFGGHPGLLLLYAERLAHTEKPLWVPRSKALEYLELVLTGLGKERSPLLAALHQERIGTEER